MLEIIATLVDEFVVGNLFDDGVLFDISEQDVSVTSLASFAVSAYMEKLGDDRCHLTTMSYNQSAFLVKPTAN